MVFYAIKQRPPSVELFINFLNLTDVIKNKFLQYKNVIKIRNS